MPRERRAEPWKPPGLGPAHEPHVRWRNPIQIESTILTPQTKPGPIIHCTRPKWLLLVEFEPPGKRSKQCPQPDQHHEAPKQLATNGPSKSTTSKPSSHTSTKHGQIAFFTHQTTIIGGTWLDYFVRTSKHTKNPRVILSEGLGTRRQQLESP